MFRNRTEAGRLLAARLQHYCHVPGVVLAVPRGGVPLAYEVALALHLPLELVLVKKIGHPANKEYAVGAVSLTGSYVVPHSGVSPSYIKSEIKSIRLRLQKMQQKFMNGCGPANIRGKTLIIIDDGIATGHTLLATVHMLRQMAPAKIIVAVPVAATEAVKMLQAEVEELIVLHVPETFSSVGAFYNDFTQVSDKEVLYYLNKLRYELKKRADPN